MVRFLAQQGVEKGLARGFGTAAMRFHGDEDCIHFGHLFRIIEAQNPAAVRFAVHVQNPQIHGASFFAKFRRFLLSPDLEDAGILYSRLMIKVKGVKDKRFILCVEDASVWLTCAASAVYIEDVCYVELAGAHQLADVTV